MKRLLLDVDGVCADILTPALAAVAAVGGGVWDPATFPTWEVFDTVPRQHREATHAIWHSKGWCRSIKPYPAALAAIPRLRQVADVRFVTSPMSRSPYWMWERDQWLRKHFNAEHHDIVFTRAKYLVEGDVFVDDNLDHVLAWSDAHPKGKAVLWEASYNRGRDFLDGIMLTSDWDAILDLLW